MKKYQIYTLALLIFAGWLYGFYLYTGRMELDFIVISLFGVVFTFLFIAAVKGIFWRVENGVDLFATLETDPEKLKLKLYMKMLQCQIDHFPEVLSEITQEAHNYPQWDILGSQMFKAWYKHNVDYMLQHPANYELSWLTDGSPYIKEYDPQYNIDALPWEETDWTETPMTQ